MRGTRRSAVNREKPKVSHKETRPGKSSRRSQETTYQAEQSTNVAQHLEVSNKEKQVRLERRGSTSSSNKSPRKQNRPPSAHGNHSFPKLSIPNNSTRPDSSYYGIPSPAVGIPGAQHNLAIRPRAQTSQTYSRPSSFYASSTSTGAPAPPLSYSAAFYPSITPSYPPPSPSSSYMRYAATPQPTQPQYSVAPAYQTISQGADYFTPHASARPLASRFDPIARTQSAMDTIPRSGSAFGTRELNPRVFHESYSYEPPDGSYYDDGYASANEVATIRRRDSKRASTRLPAASAFSKAEADSRAMPPPAPRAGILRRSTAAGYSHEPVGQELEYRDSRKQYRDEPRGPRRPSLNRHSVSYDLDTRDGGVSIEPANTGRRRQSYYNVASSSGTGASSAYEDQLKQASNYQADVGGPTVPLTAEVLRRQQRREAGSSRSTKSSASRDESDYKKSATTRTTRSGSGNDDENVTIKVTGQARVMVGGAQIDCTDGGAIEIKRNQRPRGAGSERSNSEYGENRRIEDRQSRITRPSARSRISSQSGQSYTRTPQYPPMGNYI